MDNIINGELQIDNPEIFFENLTEKVSQDAKLLNLIQKKDSNYKKILCLIFSIIVVHFSLEIIDGNGIFATIMSFGYIFLIFYTIYYVAHGKSRNLKRTDHGEELNKRVEGLKQYLKDYSLLSERDSKELELWDEYLIYSVMFGQNLKIVEEYEKYIKI